MISCYADCLVQPGQAGNFLRAKTHTPVSLEPGHQTAIALKARLDRVPDHGMEMVFASKRVYTYVHCDDWSQENCDIRATLFMVSASMQKLYAINL